MEVEYVNIQRNASYDPRPGEYKGRIKFKGQHGEVEIQLDNKLSNEVLRLCAESLTRATKDLAQNLTAAVFEQAGLSQLEDKS